MAAASRFSRQRREARTSGSVFRCARQSSRRVQQLMRRSRLRYAACALAIGVAGCGVLGGNQASLKTAPPPADRPQADLTAITPALEMMRALPSADPARQAELFQSTKDAATLAPTTSNKLKFALALATPGHGGSDPVAAQRQLAELLATPETLLPV